MAIVHRVGQPETEAERQTVRLLRQHLPNDYIVFHNLETLSPSGFAYQIDLLVIAPHAVYVIEEKDYSGHIRGNMREWQTFGGAVFPSPILAINRKARIVASQIKKLNPGLAKVYCHGLVHLTTPKAKIKLHDPQADRVTIGEQLIDYLTDPANLPVPDADLSGYRDQICGAVFSGFNTARPKREIGVYHVLEKLGATAEYTEFLAEHRYLKMEPRTRLKVYHVDIYETPEKRQKQLELIFRDMNALKRLAGHPNIVRTSDIFPGEDDTFVLPTEWVDGFSLRGMLESAEPLSGEDKIGILCQVCAGLHYAHTHGVIHRDLRPENIAVCTDGNVKLFNFDFSRIADVRAETIATQVGGQLDERYTAPEVLSSPANASPQSDLYSVGIMLFESIAGSTPYTTPRELLREKEFSWQIPEERDPLARHVNDIIRRFCAYDPAGRFPTAAAAAERLRPLCRATTG